MTPTATMGFWLLALGLAAVATVLYPKKIVLAIGKFVKGITRAWLNIQGQWFPIVFPFHFIY